MKLKTIYLAGGCFWGTEHLMKMIPGVVSTEVGFANSKVESPSYKLVCTGATDAVETVKVDYDADIVALEKILEIYFMGIDPTLLNQQGHDVGTQYRTGIYTVDTTDLPVVEKQLDALQHRYEMPVVVEHSVLENFYTAEEYHQDYLDVNPGGYCHLSPSLFSTVRKMFEDDK